MSSTGAFIWVDPGVRFNVNGILISQPPTGGTSGSSVTKGGPASAVPIRINQPTASALPIFLIRPPMKEQESHAKAQRLRPSHVLNRDCAKQRCDAFLVPCSALGDSGPSVLCGF